MAFMAINSTIPDADLGKPQLESHQWLEPIVCHPVFLSALTDEEHRLLSVS